MSKESIKDRVSKLKEGDIVLSAKESEDVAAIVIKNDSIVAVSPNSVVGISIDKDGIMIQGDVTFSGKGISIKKESYSENPNSAKIFTYTETVYFESMAAEAAYKAKMTAAQVAGSQQTIEAQNKLTAVDVGKMPIITDIAAGPLPHTHTINMKHVHRIEPAYIYNVPPYVKMFKGFMDLFKGFLSA